MAANAVWAVYCPFSFHSIPMCLLDHPATESSLSSRMESNEFPRRRFLGLSVLIPLLVAASGRKFSLNFLSLGASAELGAI